MIQSFADEVTETFYFTGKPGKAGWRDIASVVARKLDYLHRATTLNDLAAPPGNRLEALKGDREGRHSIRVNDKWRICFVWTEAGPAAVEVLDYH